MSTEAYDYFHALMGGKKPSPPLAERAVQIHGRRIDGTYYIRAADVVALLEANAVLPTISAKLKAASE